MKTGKYLVLKKENLAKNTYSLWIECPEVAQEAQAGQFVHVKVEGFSLRRPISICEVTEKAIRIVFDVRGEGTEAMTRINQGDMIDLLAPLGHGFTLLEPEKPIVVLGGGIGVPPMLEVAKHYGTQAKAIIGFQTASKVILKEDFTQYGADVTVCTDDGTMGVHGFVTQALEEHLKQSTPAMIYACGPKPMLKGIVEMAKQHNIPCEVSLEERMACGVGACLVCQCKLVKNGEEFSAHVCKDGPVFPAEEVQF
ncbi:dihydroorotate dehydrogenase electron transfer subunit [Massilioclostridium coli]|uniref:dihydroorotate dehydrogenase electron transfer subunit n=1 Tax=Massilioclostridium coli TaxID=1870991 RepID=UPI0022E67898|nr:dihydroorotate dehydrogenase electron transfer subunit [Massilioclostridium coli]